MPSPNSSVLHPGYLKTVAKSVFNRKVYHFTKDFILRRKPYPFSITLNVTTACNLHCSYCEIPTHEKQEPEMDYLVRLARSVGQRAIHFNLTGGEPLLRKDLGTLVDTIKDLPGPTYLTLFTNGKLLSQRKDVVRRIDETFISFDGSRDFHDKRRGAGAFDGAMDAMKTLADMGKTYSATCVLSRGSEKELDFVFEHATKNKFKVGFIPVRVYSRSPQVLDELEPSPDEMHRMIERIMKFPLASNSMPGLEQLAKWPVQPVLTRPCMGGTTFFALEADGRLYRCCERRPEQKVPEPVDPDRALEWIERMPRESCTGCWNIEGMEMTMMFALEPRSIRKLVQNARVSHAMRRA